MHAASWVRLCARLTSSLAAPALTEHKGRLHGHCARQVLWSPVLCSCWACSPADAGASSLCLNAVPVTLAPSFRTVMQQGMKSFHGLRRDAPSQLGQQHQPEEPRPQQQQFHGLAAAAVGCAESAAGPERQPQQPVGHRPIQLAQRQHEQPDRSVRPFILLCSSFSPAVLRRVAIFGPQPQGLCEG